MLEKVSWVEISSVSQSLCSSAVIMVENQPKSKKQRALNVFAPKVCLLHQTCLWLRVQTDCRTRLHCLYTQVNSYSYLFIHDHLFILLMMMFMFRGSRRLTTIHLTKSSSVSFISNINAYQDVMFLLKSLRWMVSGIKKQVIFLKNAD